MIRKILLILVFLLPLAGCAKPSRGFGRMRLCVVDGMTDAPIPGAAVVVPETGERFTTDEMGVTELMELPVIRDSEYDLLLEDPEGRISFLVLAEGYTPYLLLYARLTPGCEREARILLFPDDGTLPVFTVIEAPSAEWTRALAEKYGR